LQDEKGGYTTKPDAWYLSDLHQKKGFLKRLEDSRIQTYDKRCRKIVVKGTSWPEGDTVKLAKEVCAKCIGGLLGAL